MMGWLFYTPCEGCYREEDKETEDERDGIHALVDGFRRRGEVEVLRVKLNVKRYPVTNCYIFPPRVTFLISVM